MSTVHSSPVFVVSDRTEEGGRERTSQETGGDTEEFSNSRETGYMLPVL